MSVVEVLEHRGGVASRAALIAATSCAEVDRALRAEAIVAASPGRYTLPLVDEAVRIAHAASGVLCLENAALSHGWEVARTPKRPQVVFPRKRRVPERHRAHMQVHRADLHPSQSDGVATDVTTTLEMSMRLLPLPDALAITDSALRAGSVSPAGLRGIAAGARGPGSAQMRRVAMNATREAANPFESVLRAIALDVPGLHPRPQVVIRGHRVWAQCDLVDAELGIVLEADSFEWHGKRRALDRDANRYNRLVVDGWPVLRFSWEAVMLRPDEVREVLIDAVACVTARTKRQFSRRKAA